MALTTDRRGPINDRDPDGGIVQPVRAIWANYAPPLLRYFRKSANEAFCGGITID